MKFSFNESFDFINTSESFFKDYLLNDDKMLMPYVNLTIMDGHPLNKTGIDVQLNYGYMVFTGVVLVKRNKSWIYDKSQFRYGKYKFFDVGGTNIDSGENEDLKILCETGYLQVGHDAVIESKFWIPIETPNYCVNLNATYLKYFFGFKMLPIELEKIFLK
ncbi:hypothetical protein [Pedobacter sp. SL55]|uniref:hypothetical protein n=1 Tax=Pedobacter sp. SL55 TaxID=2995161 RepID=UPI002270876A|nr:hypothetical protein [Pedobacter sp. SL55]WAC40111.1 hypothetical protein OVA16_16225 [Pedobacter sp. SL55]